MYKCALINVTDGGTNEDKNIQSAARFDSESVYKQAVGGTKHRSLLYLIHKYILGLKNRHFVVQTFSNSSTLVRCQTTNKASNSKINTNSSMTKFQQRKVPM